MSVSYDYYRCLEEKYCRLWKEYEDMKLGDRLDDLGSFEKRYEVISDSVDTIPSAGRYDRFFYQEFRKTKKYRPSKKLLSKIPNTSNAFYEYNYKDGKIVFVRIFRNSRDGRSVLPVSNCSFVFENGSANVFAISKKLELIRLIEPEDHKTSYLCIMPPSFGSPCMEQFVVPDEGEEYDFFFIQQGLCYRLHYSKGMKVQFRDSKFVEVQEGKKVDEESLQRYEKGGYQKVIIPKWPFFDPVEDAKSMEDAFSRFFGMYLGEI